jgi:hypothetical protein
LEEPSSQSSAFWTSPSPQRGGRVQVREQVDAAVPFLGPSSHCSPNIFSVMPLPQ